MRISYHYYYQHIILLFSSATVILAADESYSSRTGTIVIDTQKLDTVYYRAAIITLIKGKAKRALRDLPSIEAKIFAQCATDAQSTPVALAKCALVVFNARDAADAAKRQRKSEPKMAEIRPENDWLGWLAQRFWPVGMGQLTSKDPIKPIERLNKISDSYSTKSTRTELTQRDLSRENLLWSELTQRDFDRSDLPRQDLSFKSNFFQSDLTQSDMSQRNLSREELLRPDLSQFDRYKAERKRKIRKKLRYKTNNVEKLAIRYRTDNVEKLKESDVKTEEPEFGTGPFTYGIEKMSKNEADLNRDKSESEKPNRLRKILRQFETRLAERRHAARNSTRNRLAVERVLFRRRRRRKRRVEGASAERCYAAKLRELQEFYDAARDCEKFMIEMGESNAKFFADLRVPIAFRVEQTPRSVLWNAAENRFSKFVKQNYRVLSPKLFSLLPDKAIRAGSFSRLANESVEAGNEFLSPSLLSFQNDNAFSLPSILGLALPESEKHAWLELLLDASGAGRVLDRMHELIRPQMRDLHERLRPAVRRLRDAHARFRLLYAAQNKRQTREMHAYGYTVVSGAQASILGDYATGKWNDELNHLSAREIDALIERDIRELAQFADNGQTTVSNANQTTMDRVKRMIHVEKFGNPRIMNPYFFRHQMHEGAVLRRVILSPRAFGVTMTSPDFYGISVLSPHAFRPLILSPRALYASILSPYAFGGNLLTPQFAIAEILSPRALFMSILSPRFAYATVLSPRMLMAEVLSPKAAQLDVASSVAVSFSVLSPTTLTAKFGSPPAYVLSILSPNILNANFFSKGHMNIQVLSPSILTHDQH